MVALDPSRETESASMRFAESGTGIIDFELADGSTETVQISREKAGALWKMVRDQCEAFDDE